MEALGIATHVTWPRTKCSIEGKDINGNPVDGDYGVKTEDFIADEDAQMLSKRTGKITRGKDAKAIYKLGQLVLANLKIFDEYIEIFHIVDCLLVMGLFRNSCNR